MPQHEVTLGDCIFSLHVLRAVGVGPLFDLRTTVVATAMTFCFRTTCTFCGSFMIPILLLYIIVFNIYVCSMYLR